MKKNFAFSDFNLELQILIRAGEAALDKEKKTQLEAVVNDKVIDWEKVYKLASIHQIRPLLLRGVSGLQNIKIPSNVLNKLKTDCLHIATKNLANTNEMLNILNLFKENDILVVPYKGAYLASKYYGDFGLREFSDIDLFIKEEDLCKVKNILLNHDYLRYFELNDNQEKWNHNIDYNHSFYKLDSNGDKLFHLEIHYRTTPSYYQINMNLKNMPKPIEDVYFLSRPITVLSKEVHLSFIITHHGVTEAWSKLKYIFDLKFILDDKNLDLEIVKYQLDIYKITPVFIAGIDLLKVLFPDFQFNNIFITNNKTKKFTQLLIQKIDVYNGCISNKKIYFRLIQYRWMFDKRPKILLSLLSPILVPSRTDFIYFKSNLPIFFYFFLRLFRLLSSVFI